VEEGKLGCGVHTVCFFRTSFLFFGMCAVFATRVAVIIADV